MKPETIKQYAERHDCSVEAVYKWVQRGLVRFRREGPLNTIVIIQRARPDIQMGRPRKDA